MYVYLFLSLFKKKQQKNPKAGTLASSGGKLKIDTSHRSLGKNYPLANPARRPPGGP